MYFSIAANISCWGALLSWLFILFMLKARHKPIEWFGITGLRDLTNFLVVIKEEQRSFAKAMLVMVFVFHLACLLGMVALFIIG